jgi:hypothetical protein
MCTDAVTIFSSRAGGVPTTVAQCELIQSFIHNHSNDYFIEGPQRSQFSEVCCQLKTLRKESSTELTRAWPKSYCAEKLFLLFFVGVNKDSERTAKISKTAARKKAKAQKTMTSGASTACSGPSTTLSTSSTRSGSDLT